MRRVEIVDAPGFEDFEADEINRVEAIDGRKLVFVTWDNEETGKPEFFVFGEQYVYVMEDEQ